MLNRPWRNYTKVVLAGIFCLSLCVNVSSLAAFLASKETCVTEVALLEEEQEVCRAAAVGTPAPGSLCTFVAEAAAIARPPWHSRVWSEARLAHSQCVFACSAQLQGVHREHLDTVPPGGLVATPTLPLSSRCR